MKLHPPYGGTKLRNTNIYGIRLEILTFESYALKRYDSKGVRRDVRILGTKILLGFNGNEEDHAVRLSSAAGRSTRR